MFRLALSLTLPIAAVRAMPAEDLRQWHQFDQQCGLPDKAAQWQRGLLLTSKAGKSARLDDFMPLLAFGRPSGADALLERLKHGKE